MDAQQSIGGLDDVMTSITLLAWPEVLCRIILALPLDGGHTHLSVVAIVVTDTMCFAVEPTTPGANTTDIHIHLTRLAGGTLPLLDYLQRRLILRVSSLEGDTPI